MGAVAGVSYLLPHLQFRPDFPLPSLYFRYYFCASLSDSKDCQHRTVFISISTQ